MKLPKQLRRRAVGLAVWLLLILLFHVLCRFLPQWADYGREYIGLFKLGVSWICSPLPFCLAELLCVLFILWLLIYLLRSIFQILRSQNRLLTLSDRLLRLLTVLAGLYFAFCLTWGINFYATSFQQEIGLSSSGGTVTQLQQVTEYFARQLSRSAAMVPRNENGVFQADYQDIFARSSEVYQVAAVKYPCLELDAPPPKAMLFSRLMSYMGFTGVTFPLTQENCLNVDAPSCMLPATVAHEQAHSRGFASEQECNFLAVLACTSCSDPVYLYSGWLFGYLSLSNALYRADPNRAQEIYASLPETVKADLASRRAYWQQFEGPVNTAAESVYDIMLKGYGESDGIQSYGTAVDLLIAYYLPRAERRWTPSVPVLSAAS